MFTKLQELRGKLRCKLGRHDFKEVPFEWRDEGPPEAPSAIRGGTNAECRRCGVRYDINWPRDPEEIAQTLLEAELWDSYRTWRKYHPEKPRGA